MSMTARDGRHAVEPSEIGIGMQEPRRGAMWSGGRVTPGLEDSELGMLGLQLGELPPLQVQDTGLEEINASLNLRRIATRGQGQGRRRRTGLGSQSGSVECGPVEGCPLLGEHAWMNSRGRATGRCHCSQLVDTENSAERGGLDHLHVSCRMCCGPPYAEGANDGLGAGRAWSMGKYTHTRCHSGSSGRMGRCSQVRIVPVQGWDVRSRWGRARLLGHTLLPQQGLRPHGGVVFLPQEGIAQFGSFHALEALRVDSFVKLGAAVADLPTTHDHVAHVLLIPAEIFMKKGLGVRTLGDLSEAPSVQLAGEAAELALLEVPGEDGIGEALGAGYDKGTAVGEPSDAVSEVIGR